MKILFTALVFFFFNSTITRAQSKHDFIIGYGVPELSYIGLQYNISKNTKIGASMGNLFFDTKGVSYCFNISFYYGKKSKYTDNKIWYNTFGYSNLFSVNDGNKEINYFVLYDKIGKTIELNKTMGLKIDAGLMMISYRDYDVIETNFSPCLGIQLCFKIL